ncbi:MAG: DUF1080 domain-containing protein [Candidatus Hydrogenedentes bacterium]|nr:DUF1080 domain-containing protein [Candidatus Hydrogenedentota bacterium]
MRTLSLAGMAVWAAWACFAADDKWMSLRPDKEFKGWLPISGQWQIDGEELIGKATGGEMAWILSTQTYADFELKLEFITPVPCNGGVQFRSHWLPVLPIPEGVNPADAPKQIYGYQADIDTRGPDTTKDRTGAIVDENGRWGLATPADATVRRVRPSEWNTMRVKAVGDKIEVYVNGVPASEVQDDRMLQGGLGLQVNSRDFPGIAEVRYRNILVRDLGRGGNWRTLFDGKTLKGWKEWGTESWSVEDGAIVGRSGPKKSEGYLATNETWKDFRVRGQFKMMGTGNFGLFYHSTITLREDGYPVISGLQGEVAPEFPGPTGWVYESYKRGWLVKPDPATLPALALRPGDWNEIEIRSADNHITTWVNGLQVLDHVDDGQQLHEGSFALQLHTGGVDGIMWKEIYVEK